MQSSIKLVVCIASTALFDCSESHEIWKRDGVEAYTNHQRENVNKPLQPGVGFPLVQSLLKLNEVVDNPIIDIVLVSRNDGGSVKRIINSINYYKLSITRTSFTCGEEVTKYLPSWECDLFLSTEEEQVREVLTGGSSNSLQGIAAGLVYTMVSVPIPAQPITIHSDNPVTTADTTFNSSSWSKDQVRIVFDGDGVLFLEEPQPINFEQCDHQMEQSLLAKGPIQAFALKLQNVRQALGEDNKWRIRTFLVTSNTDANAIRVIQALEEMGLDLNETHILNGLDKTPFLRVIDPAISFYHSNDNVGSSSEFIPSVHVPCSRQTSRASISDIVLISSNQDTKPSTFNDNYSEEEN
ncbi:hypothetical protein I4U23_017181 [Adineta vaga]|nr:hypothetical protein I4U23_017181 [Adineta vaga]